MHLDWKKHKRCLVVECGRPAGRRTKRKGRMLMGELSIERDEVLRIRTSREPGMLAKALAAAGEHGANIGEIETVHIGADYNIREVVVIAPDDEAIVEIIAAMDAIDGV
jgi:hypothetical protein